METVRQWMERQGGANYSMPVTKWICPTHGREVDLDHFNFCSGTHPDYAAAVLADRAKQAERVGVRVSLASSCPRKYAIMATEDVAIDPLSNLTAMKGTAWHAMLEKSSSPAEEGLGNEIAVTGEIAGIPISGRIDRVRYFDGKLTIEDFKTGKDARAVFIRGGKSYGKQIAGNGAPIEYKIQLSLYCALYEQQFGKKPDAAAIWWWFSAESWCEPIKIMTVEECLLHHPYDSEFTVGDILAQAQLVADGAVRWQVLPLVGKTFKFGPKFTGCDYCEVRDKCWVADSGAPF